MDLLSAPDPLSSLPDAPENFPGGDLLARLLAQAESSFRAARAGSTLRAYAHDCQHQAAEAVYDRESVMLIEVPIMSNSAGSTPEAVVKFHPSDSVQRRVAELVERSNEGTISSEDQSELEDYLQLEHIMIMAKARARQHTQLGN